MHKRCCLHNGFVAIFHYSSSFNFFSLFSVLEAQFSTLSSSYLHFSSFSPISRIFFNLAHFLLCRTFSSISHIFYPSFFLAIFIFLLLFSTFPLLAQAFFLLLLYLKIHSFTSLSLIPCFEYQNTPLKSRTSVADTFPLPKPSSLSLPCLFINFCLG